MSDVKLFRIGDKAVSELEGHSAAVEKSIQTLLERHLDDFLGVRFLASEYKTGKTHGGRIDSLGIDENNSPVIIEYKRALNENVINQGLYYLDWLLDHKAEFTLLVMDKLGKDTSEKIAWAGTRLLCVAGDFTKYDQHAVQQINRNIELIRYRQYGDDLLLLDLVNATTATGDVGQVEQKKVAKGTYKTVAEYLHQAPSELRDLYEEVKAFLLAMGDDVQEKELQYYFACLPSTHVSNPRLDRGRQQGRRHHPGPADHLPNALRGSPCPAARRAAFRPLRRRPHAAAVEGVVRRKSAAPCTAWDNNGANWPVMPIHPRSGWVRTDFRATEPMREAL